VNRTYLCIDLKSYYSSVECVDRGLDPLTTNLVVADIERTEKTICLAVTPSLKAYGISGRARLFEVIQKVNEVNSLRKYKAPGRKLDGASSNDIELKNNPSLALDYIVAPPRMAHYMEVSAKIYDVYLKYIAPEDVFVYSIDEVFIDITHYLGTYKLNAREMAQMMIKDVLETTGITATAGIGTNMYLAKIAMDIMAKKMPPDKNGVRIAELDEMTYRKELWDHRPLTDFWMVGGGISRKLEANYMYTMGDVARCSHYNEAQLFKLFGVNAELLIDRAWGWEPTTIADIREYKPSSNSMSVGQVLHCPYDYEKAKLIVKEMIDQHALDLFAKGLVTDQLVLDIGYDIENLTDPERSSKYHGEVTTDHYGRKVPKHAHGTVNLQKKTSSSRVITQAVVDLYDRIVDRNLLIRRINIAACKLTLESDVKDDAVVEQLTLFDDPEELQRKKEAENAALARERRMQKAVVEIKARYGKNAILKGMNLQEGATAKDRNSQVGGHRA
jgi:DNA polymerase V